MANWIVKCLETNLIKLIVGGAEPTECPVDGCNNFTTEEEK